MWEARVVERHHVSSKVLCWVALDRAVRFGTALGSPEDLARWASARDEVRAAVLQQGWRAEVGAYTGAFGSDELDACVLVMPLVGFLPATDGRMRATIELIENRVSSDGLVRRWPIRRVSSWLVQCLALVGERERAIAMFEGLAGRASDLGLFAEQIDPQTGEQLGNFPQAFSHIALIDAAWLLINTTCPPDNI